MPETPDIRIMMKNEAKIARAWAKFPADFSNDIAQALRATATFVTGKVKEYIASGEGMWKAPLDTGTMRRGIHPTFESNRAVIKPSSYTPYATYVHEGTAHMRPRPFFTITADRSKDEIDKFMQGVIERSIKRLAI